MRYLNFNTRNCGELKMHEISPDFCELLCEAEFVRFGMPGGVKHPFPVAIGRRSSDRSDKPAIPVLCHSEMKFSKRYL